MNIIIKLLKRIFKFDWFSIKNSGVYFLCKETEYLLPYYANANNIDGVVWHEQTDTELRKITCSADRSGYLKKKKKKKLIL